MKTTNLFFTLLIACFGGIGIQAQTAAQPAATEIVINETSAGPITKTTPFNHRQIQTLFPTLTVKRSTGMSEGDEFPVIHILEKKTLLMVVYQNENQKKVGGVEILSNRVKLASGIKLGATFAQIFPGLKSLKAANCFAGEEEMTGRLFCNAPGSRRQQLMFFGPGDIETGLRPVKFFRNWKVESVTLNF